MLGALRERVQVNHHGGKPAAALRQPAVKRHPRVIFHDVPNGKVQFINDFLSEEF